MDRVADPVVGRRLAPWKEAVLAWGRSDWPSLTNRQLALLMVVCHEPGPHPVRRLASRLAVSKPIISRILDRLTVHNLITRENDRRDRRNVYATPTRDAFRLLDELDRYFLDPATVPRVLQSREHRGPLESADKRHRKLCDVQKEGRSPSLIASRARV